jgi:chromosome segregation ATPase
MDPEKMIAEIRDQLEDVRRRLRTLAQHYSISSHARGIDQRERGVSRGRQDAFEEAADYIDDLLRSISTQFKTEDESEEADEDKEEEPEEADADAQRRNSGLFHQWMEKAVAEERDAALMAAVERLENRRQEALEKTEEHRHTLDNHSNQLVALQRDMHLALSAVHALSRTPPQPEQARGHMTKARPGWYSVD